MPIIVGTLPPLSPAELVPVFIELSTARRSRPQEVEERAAPPELEQREDELYAVVPARLHKAASVADITPAP